MFSRNRAGLAVPGSRDILEVVTVAYDIRNAYIVYHSDNATAVCFSLPRVNSLNSSTGDETS